jgi:hypothetical protein
VQVRTLARDLRSMGARYTAMKSTKSGISICSHPRRFVSDQPI